MAPPKAWRKWTWCFGNMDGRFRLSISCICPIPVFYPSSLFPYISDFFREIAAAFLANHLNHLYVIDASGRFVGVVALHDVKGYLDQPELARLLIAEDIMHEDFPRIMPESGLEEALRSFERIQSERIPVVKEEANAELVGSLSKTDLLRHMAGHGRRR